MVLFFYERVIILLSYTCGRACTYTHTNVDDTLHSTLYQLFHWFTILTWDMIQVKYSTADAVWIVLKWDDQAEEISRVWEKNPDDVNNCLSLALKL